MASVINMLGAAQALLVLAALLAVGARADVVTFRQCGKRPDVYPYNSPRIVSPTELAKEQDNVASSLDASFCRLTEISDVVFIRRPNLVYVNYNNNEIQSVDPTVFSGAPQIRSLFFRGNRLTSLPVFGKAMVLPNVVELSFGNNKITRLASSKIFSSMKELKIVHLESNLIEDISPDVFHGLPRLEFISLYNNRLKYIPDNTFAIPSLNSVSVSSNRVEYISPGAFRGTRLHNLYLERNRLTYLPEHFVSSLTGGTLKYFLFYENCFQCSCLSELLAEVAQLDDCQYLFKPTCVQTEDTQCRRLSEAEYINGQYTNNTCSYEVTERP